MSDTSLFQTKQSRESAVDAVVNRFRELIAQGKLKPGDLLPSEGALAEAMGVSRGSVREAMKILSALGVVEVRRGDGTYVSTGMGRTLLDPFLLRLMLSAPDRRQLVEFREMIELAVARAAHRNRTAQRVAAVNAAVAATEAALTRKEPDSAALAELDLSFHRALGQATGNVLIGHLYEFILQYFEPSIRETYDQPGNVERAFGYHREICRALNDGTEQELLAAVNESIRGWAGEEETPC